MNVTFAKLDVANARIRVMEAILSRLPQTADGEYVTPGSTIYRLYEGHTRNGSRYVTEETVESVTKYGGVVTEEGPPDAVKCSKIYGSREMAEAHVPAGRPIKFARKKRKNKRSA